MTDRTSARSIRGALKDALSRAFVKALHDRGVEQREAAAAMGVGHSLVQRQCDHRRAESTHLVDVVLLYVAGHRDVAEDLVRWVADHLGLRVERAVDVSPATSWHALTGDLVEDCAKLHRALVDATSGTLDERQRALILSRLDVVERHLFAARRRLATPALRRAA